jgi:acetyl esterase/lipase
VFLGLPGGGWRWVDRNSLGVTLASLASNGYAVAVADYAFASSSPGSHVWPANFDDVQNAVRWIRGNADRFGFDPSKIAVWGESAGGHLANLLGTDPAGPAGGPAPRGPYASLPANVQAVIDFYGPTDLAQLYANAPKVRPYLQTFLGGTPQQFPQRYADASPVTHVSSSDPPFLIYQGLSDTANVQIATYFPETPHGFRLKPYGNQGVDLLPQILQFLDDALNHAGQGIPK